MAGGKSRAGGCLAVFALAIAAVIAVAFGLGAVDYLRYSASGEREFGHEALELGFEERIDAELEERYYAYAQLDEEGRRCYRIMYDAFRSRESRAYPENGASSLSSIRSCIVADHPELFYVEGVKLSTTYNQVSDLVSATTITGSFYSDAEQVASTQAQIDQVVAAFLATVPEGADDYTRAKLAYEYIIRSASYNHDAAALIDWGAGSEGRMPGQTMDDVFLGGTAVCAGYSAAYQYLLQQMGIVCVQVRGTADGVGHAWCMAYLDGAFYNIDPTWGDPQFSDEDDVGTESYVNYDYLAVTDADMASTHAPDVAFALPACTAAMDNYYVREGLLLDQADEDFLADLVSDAEEAGTLCVQVRCATEEVYRTLLDGFITTGDLGYFVSDYEYRYTTSDPMRSITVFP